MVQKISYSPLESDMEKILKLVERERYRSPEVFLDRAIQILLTWESEHPERCMDIMKTMTPFTEEQERFMNQTMIPEEKEKHFGNGDYLSEAIQEAENQAKFSPAQDDYIKLRKNLELSKNYIKKLQIKKPQTNEITYDQYPILFRFYSRILPAKIVLTTLGDLLREVNDTKIELKVLRLKAYDIAEEISNELQKYEENNNKKRNEKLSTGLPKIEKNDEVEKIARIQKRFKEQYIGKLRKNRQTNLKHFEGVLIALDLIYVEEDNENLYISLTEKGKEFYLLDNPIIQGDYSKPFSEEEEKFVYQKLLPKLKLEYKFIQTALKTIKTNSNNTDKKITEILDEEFYKTLREYEKVNPKEVEIYELETTSEEMDDGWKKYITGLRVATMSRMAELSLVKWTIDDTGNSKFIIPEKVEIPA